ncbi:MULTISPECIES: MBL fold metallo-hydrolase RNA specificity domain-containing protein [Nocardioides]|uniref:MBL fold metallo-hydrolase RNA specificity domain-containing protein n=1 Tax=Nocardioides vastitatis TaxID=2568655 RepID=A0ABW0ZP27_9ACTN|nr:MBL fold metallo-hydrolase [Nocardioides sp.]THJ06223.1 MBL fold metallo-hydrolase [Nocardioides sp.]
MTAFTGSASPVLTFLGASGTVTGSRFLVERGEEALLVDAGLYQGPSSLRRRNWEPPPFDPGALEGIVLTHAHLDHCGYLPCLVRDGFTGDVLCTQETADLAGIVLRDSAHLQEEEARYANQAGWSRHRPALPLYSAGDVERALPHLRDVAYGASHQISAALAVTLDPAGHILGSATATIDVGDRRVAFSGDLGRTGHPLLRPPGPPVAAAALVVESTYGDRLHPPPNPDLLRDAIRRTVARGGVVLVPAFAVDRTELVLLELQRLEETGAIPRVPIYVDSPMALDALGVYLRALHQGSPQLRGDRCGALDDLERLDLHAVRDATASRRLNAPDSPCIIVSASGMATGGRVVHHLAHQLPDERNCVVLTGYQAPGTRGRQLLDGARHVKLHGRYTPVRAEVVDIPDFSVHADADELVAWVASAQALPRMVYVVHGEPDASESLARRIEDELGICAVAPRLGERVRLD